MGQVFQYQAVPDDARPRGAEQSQLEGTAERTARQWGPRSCIRGVELIVITSGNRLSLPRTSGQAASWRSERAVGLEVRELTLDCKVSGWMMPGSPLSVTWTHFLMMRPEHTAIWTWLSWETLNLQSPAGVNPKGEAKEVVQSARCFSKHLLCEHETWTESFSRNLLDFNQSHATLCVCTSR